MVLGSYPQEGLKELEEFLPAGFGADMSGIAQPLDFFDFNCYQGTCFAADEAGTPRQVDAAAGAARTAFGWPITPDALYWGPRFHYERYGLAIVIAENGTSSNDWVGRGVSVHDPQRIEYLATYLSALSRAGDDGVPLKAYFQWTLMDNFDWYAGYSQRFGLVHVDFQSLARTPKDSYDWFARVVRSNGSGLSLPA